MSDKTLAQKPVHQWLFRLDRVNPPAVEYFIVRGSSEEVAVNRWVKRVGVGPVFAKVNEEYQFKSCSLPADVERDYPKFVTDNPSEYFHDDVTERLAVKLLDPASLVKAVQQCNGVVCLAPCKEEE